MSIDNANKFLTKLYEHDREARALLPKGIEADTIGSAEIALITSAALEAGWDFTAEELQEAYLESLSVDDKELSAVAGGWSILHVTGTASVSAGSGGCSSNYYVEQCEATVEPGSNCQCTDFDNNYHTY